MAQFKPAVDEDRLTYHLDGRTHTIMLDMPEWYAWLDTATTFTFRSTAGTFTARKERAGNNRGGRYWKAYRKRAGKLYSAYLGKAETVTLQRLQAVAAQLNNAVQRSVSRITEAPPAGSESLPAAAPAASSAEPSVEQATPPPVGRLFNLPTQLSSLVGREQNTAQVCTLLRRSDVRLVTLVGPGGVGKTRLAMAAAAALAGEFIDGVIFVSLASIRDPQLVIPALARELGLQQNTLQAVQRCLHDWHLLLVLDNFEQVASAAPLLEEILMSAPHVKAMITSRLALQLQGEHRYPVLPLSLPAPDMLAQIAAEAIAERSAAVMLFTQRARAVLPHFQLTVENMQAVAAICIRLDGLPLAIELAAARITLFSPQALLARLAQRLDVLSGGGRTLPERQRSLYTTLQWSYELLDAGERRLFRRMAIFVGGCTLEAIAAVCGPGEEDAATSSVSALIDHSLLYRTKQDGVEPRLAMLETVREYALDRLAQHGETEDLRRAHARYYLALAEEIAPHLQRGGHQRPWMRRLDEEHENLGAALGHLIKRREARLAVRLSGALWWYWVNRGAYSEGSAWLTAALGLPDNGPCTPARARALLGAGELALRQRRFQAASSLLEASVSGYRELGEQRGLAQALLNLGLAVGSSQRFAEARALIEESIALSRAMDDLWLMGHAKDSLSRLVWEQGDIETTRILAEQGLQLAPLIGEIRAHISPRKLLIRVALVEGNYSRAAELAGEMLAIAQDVRDQESEFSALYTLGTVAIRQGEYAQATGLFQRCLNLAAETGSVRNRGMALAWLGEVAGEQGNQALAAERYRACLSAVAAIEDQAVAGLALLGLARIEKAARHYRRAAHMLGAAGARLNLRIDLDALALVGYERDLAALGTYLGNATCTQALDAGSTMTLEQLLTLPEPSGAAPASPSILYPDDLTEREVEVLRLVAAGLSDTQVAEKLIISPRTVQGHLRSIYSKIHVHSRTAATRYAVEHRLV